MFSPFITSGVVQGSVLGGTLFTIYLDSLLSTLDIPVSAYADDFKFVADLFQYTNLQVQRNISKVYEWSIEMELPLSLAKCLVVHYGTMNGHFHYICGKTYLHEEAHFSDLGILRSRDMDFRDHMANVAQKARRLIGLCFRSFTNRD